MTTSFHVASLSNDSTTDKNPIVSGLENKMGVTAVQCYTHVGLL